MTTRYVLSLCTALVVGGAFVAVSAHALGDADQNALITVKSDQGIRLIRENAFFDRHIDKAVKHAAAAEVAGSQGKGPDLIRHTQLSLDQAREAQRAGNVPGLNEGIVALRETLNMPQGASLEDATASVRDARIKLAQAGGIRTVDNRMAGAVPSGMNAQYGRGTRTVKGELIGDEVSSRKEGGNHYFLRDQAGKDLPITLTEDMGRHMRAGDKVEAQIDADGLVLAIAKEQ